VGKAKKNTPKPRKRGKAATAGGETAGGETWDEWQQSRHILRVPRIRETIFDLRVPRIREGIFDLRVPLIRESIFNRMDRRLARIDQRLAESAAVPARLLNPSVAPVRRLIGKKWVPVAFERRREELLALTITEAGRRLAEESKTAPDCAKPLKPRSAEKLLRNLGLWPQAFRGSPKQRPTK
jgi:hypothetical protein